MVRGEAELELLSLGDGDGNLLDLKKDRLVRCIDAYVGAGLGAICASVLVHIHPPFLVRRLAVSLDRIVNMGGNLVEEGDPAGRI